MGLQITTDDELEDIADEKPVTKTKKTKVLDGWAEGHDKRFIHNEEARIKREILGDNYYFGELET